MDEAEQLCDRLVVMDRARIVAEGAPSFPIVEHVTKEVVELRFGPGGRGRGARLEGAGKRIEPLADRVLVYTDDADAPSVAVDRGHEPSATLTRRSTLEDVFLALTGRTLVD